MKVQRRNVTGEKLGRAAVRAVGSCIKQGICPLDAWNDGITVEFADKPLKTIKGYQDKRCPKKSFLCLIDEGYVEGIPIPAKKWVNNDNNNKKYVLSALDFIGRNKNAFLSTDEETLVQKLIDEGFVKDKKYNDQMHIVGALWKANLLRIPPIHKDFR